MTAPATGGDSVVVAVRGLGVRAGRAALVRDVDLEIRKGERVGIIGESGSGKTLTALSIMGLLADNLTASGSVRLTGVEHDLVGAGERRMTAVRGRRIGMVFQEPMTALNPAMRVGRQVAEAMTIHGVSPDRARRHTLELFGQLGLPDPGGTVRAFPYQLSGGQRQRVLLAIALANDPALLICDEPTTALDVTVQAQVLDLIVRGVESRDSALLFITHDLAVVARTCERVLVMYRGSVVEAGPVSAILTAPRHAYTQRLLAASDLLARSGRRGARAEGSARSAAVAGASAAIVLRRVHREYRRPRQSIRRSGRVVHALREVSLEIGTGERFGIVGESGSGKSTLLRLLAAIDRPTNGAIEVLGQSVVGRTERELGFLRRELQLVFQDPTGSLDPRMRVRDIVAEPLVAQGEDRPGARVQEVLEQVGLRAEMADRYPHQFSGGERQRISIARALAPRPRILLADEPVTALDVSLRAQVLDLITDLADRLELTLVFVSHDLAVVRHMCDRVAVLRDGHVVETGPTADVYENPQHPYTQQLVRAIPTIRGALGRSLRQSGSGDRC